MTELENAFSLDVTKADWLNTKCTQRDSKWSEVRNDYYEEYDPVEGYWSIDAWETSDGGEPGAVVAQVYKNRVVFMHEDAQNDPYVRECVQECFDELEDMEE